MKISNTLNNLLASRSHNNIKLIEHVENVIDHLVSPDYNKKDSLIEVSKKIKICNNSKPNFIIPDPIGETLRSSIILRMSEVSQRMGYKEPNPNLYLKNFELDSKKLYWAGIDFGDQTAKLIQQSLRKLAHDFQASSIRFWGKICGKRNDYYIVQGTLTNGYLQELPPDGEKYGQGVNTYTYWVANDLLGWWEQLPLVTPQQVNLSKKFKRIFTGNLNTKIQSFPAFNGKQSHYLKCQLVRISHACEIVPRGIYKLNDDNPKLIEFEQQPKIPEFSELQGLENWVHQNPAILNIGRCSHWIDPDLTEEQKQSAQTQLTEKDPEIERLKSISEDKVLEKIQSGLQNPWYSKIYGDNQVFTKEENSLVYAVVVYKNVNWPGWTSIGYKNGWSSIYIGNGLKSTQQCSSVLQNRDLQQQAQDLIEFGQPNPKQLPKVEPIKEDPPEDD